MHRQPTEHMRLSEHHAATGSCQHGTRKENAEVRRAFCLGLSAERSVAMEARASGESSGGAISTTPADRFATSTSSCVVKGHASECAWHPPPQRMAQQVFYSQRIKDRANRQPCPCRRIPTTGLHGMCHPMGQQRPCCCHVLRAHREMKNILGNVRRCELEGFRGDVLDGSMMGGRESALPGGRRRAGRASRWRRRPW